MASYKEHMGIREDIKIPIKVGDTILGGKFKNKRIVVKSISKNEKGDITINGRPLLKYRIIDKVEETVLADKIECDNCGWTWMIADGGDDLYICHKCGEDNEVYGPMSKSYKRLNVGESTDIEEIEEETKRDYKAEYKKFQSSTKSKKYRAELNKYNRDKGTYGNGDGKDASHKGGKIVGFESEKKNRGRAEKSRLKKEAINEIPMGDLQKIDQFADKKLNPIDVVLTDKHFFDRLNDPRNGKEISQAELIGFFKRLSKKKTEFLDFLDSYNSVVAVDDRTNINIPFMKQANKAIAKTVMRKKDFKSNDKKLDI